MDSDELLEMLEDYVLPAQLIPLEGWATEDLVSLEQAINAELQRRASDEYKQEVENDYREHTLCY